MRGTLEQLKINFIELSLVAFADELPTVRLPDESAYVVCWGPGFVPRVLKHEHLWPGIWYDPAEFRWSVFCEHWPNEMLSLKGRVCPFSEAVSSLSKEPVFIRPDEDNKAFAGGIYDVETPPKLQIAFDRDTPVVVAPVQPVEDEWRFVVVGGRIIDASSYRLNGQPNIEGPIPREATILAEQAMNKWCPADVFCLDIGFDGLRYGIVEANCFNASRLYSVDAIKVVKAVNRLLSGAP